MKDKNYLKGIDYAMDIGYAQFKDRKMNEHDDAIIPNLYANRFCVDPAIGKDYSEWYKSVGNFASMGDGEYWGYTADMNDAMMGDETRLFDFDGLFVEVTLPRGEFE